MQEQIQDTIFDLMRWDEGEFDFQVLPDVVDEDIGLSVSIENVVMEGSRRLEEWNRIKKKVASTEMVFKMATAPGEERLRSLSSRVSGRCFFSLTEPECGRARCRDEQDRL